MDIYKLIENGKEKIVEINGSRYLIARDSIYKIENTVIIEEPGIDSRIVWEFKRNAEDDNSELEKFEFLWIDVGDELFLFWYSAFSPSRLFGDQYQLEESNLW